MAGAQQTPRVFLRVGSPGLRDEIEGLLRNFPLCLEPPPEAAHWTLGDIQVLDLDAVRAVQADLGGISEPVTVLASSMVVHPEPLPPGMKADLYRQGFAFINEGQDFAGLKRRIEVMLRVRSRLVAEQAVNKLLKRRFESQERQMAHQTDFLHMAVHDLRGPLAAMICYAELLMEGVLGNLQSSQLEPIRTIHRNCQFLVDMVNDLLDSARLGMGKLSLKLEKTDFVREVETAAQSLRSLADTKGIKLKIESESVPEMYLDIQKVGRILTNLLGNAIKFTRAGGEIVLRVSRTSSELVFSIQDMGPGISTADRKAIFEKFNTGSGSNMPGKGHGLGLAICKSFVELHGGKIFVESTRHKGSVFIVHLPLEKRKSSAAQSAAGAGRKMLVLDFAGDVEGLDTLSKVSNPDLRFDVVQADPKTWSWERIPSCHFLMVNESPGSSDLGPDFFLLQLRGAGGTSLSRGLLVPSDMPEADKELRRSLGFWLLEKPCTPQDLFDKLQGVVGLDRRQRGR